MGVLYVCDEPSIGLHPVDNERLIRTLTRLRDLGNTVLVVEHDEAMIRAADHVIDLGPGAGEHGGRVVATGTPAEVAAHPDSLTGAYLSGRRSIPMPRARRAGSGESLTVLGAREHNLRRIDVEIPLGCFVGVTGVSGSGKSTLVNEIVAKALAHQLQGARERPGAHDAIEGLEHVDKVVVIDQSPIGRTPRSNPATYTGLFTLVRELFAQVPEARARGYKPGRFSFNVKGGRCEACSGDGYNQIEMQFLPDVTVPCDVCRGRRYNREALEIHFRGKSIADVLEMTVTEALSTFEAFSAAAAQARDARLRGTRYIRLGQPATTLSGGEAQRIKLATELSRRSTGRTVYVLDEPTTGALVLGHGITARGPAGARGRRQHRHRDRAPHGRRQERGLDCRPRSRRWRERRARRGLRHARAAGGAPGVGQRPLPGGGAGPGRHGGAAAGAPTALREGGVHGRERGRRT